MPNRAQSTWDGTLPQLLPGDPRASLRHRRPPHRKSLRAALWAAGLCLAGSLPAQDPPPPIVDEDGDYYILNVGEREGTDIKAFIKLAQLITKKTFIYSDQDIQNAPEDKITWVGPKRIKKINFFAYFQTILFIKGFATVIHGDEDTEVIEIIYMQGPKRPILSTKAVFVTADEIQDYSNQTGVQVLTSVPLNHIDATAAQNTLRPFFLGGGAAATGATLQFGVAGQSLLLQGFGPQVYAAYQLLQLVDQEPDVPEHEVRITKLVNAAADELDVILKDILEDRARRQQQAAGVSGAPVQQGQTGELKIVPHVTLNAIILSGTRDQVVEGQGLIALLDVPVEANGGDTHVVRLKNVLADDLYDTLNRFIEQDSTAERANAGAAGAATRQPRRTVVVPHKESNSLLISGTSTKFKQLQRVIDELDSRQPQVLIECAVIELATTDSARVAVELGLLDIGGDDYTRPFGFTNFGLSTFDDTTGDGIPDTRLPSFENPIPGFTGGIISSSDFAIPILVNALAANDRANILSLPSVVVNNNENALVRSLEQRPTQEISQGTATTQSGAGANEDAGITLTISPSISSNNYLRLNIDLVVSRFTTPFDPSAVTAGVVQERQIQTQITLPSGHTMVLGGVIEDAASETSTGIPILKDIPIIGWLFQSWSEDKRKTNLYFFLTPYILDEEDFSDLAELSFRKKLEAGEYIGNRRIQLIDRKWREGRPETLEDPGATIEDLDARGGFDIPYYQRPGRTVNSAGSTGPRTPDAGPTGPQQPENGR